MERAVYYIIANETHLKGKGGKNLEAVKAVFERAGKEYEVLLTHQAGDAKLCAEKITSSGGRHTLVAMGGDGTLHDILNGFKDFENCSLGIVPCGTGNDFAAATGIPRDAKKAAEIIAYRAPRPIDFIQLDSGLRSINSVGMGIDVDLLKQVYKKNMHGKSKYLRALIPALARFKSCNFTLKYDGKEEEKHYGIIAAVGNNKLLGGGIKLFPDAKINDGLLDVIIVDYISKPRMIVEFFKLVRGKIAKIKNVTFVQAKEVEFIHESNDFTIQAEGELYDNIPLRAKVEAGKLKFYLPENYD